MSPSLPWRLTIAVVLLLAMAGTATAADRALLVGIEHYADPRVNPTPGGSDDARSMARTLEQAFGFDPEGIRLLLDDAATSQAILDNFEEWLIEGSQPGDRVFFLYAGHGSQLADQNDEETDGFDETLAPYDVDPSTGAHQIRDDVIDSLIAQLTGRRAVLLFDSCHSGTLTRGSATGPEGGRLGARYLPRPEQWAGLGELRRGSGGDGSNRNYGVEAAGEGDPRPFDAPARIGRMAGIVAISAAGPGQLAYPIDVAGRPRGALTYLFEEVASRSHRGFLDQLQSEALGTAGSALGNLAGEAIQGRLDGDRLDQRFESWHQGLTIGGTQAAIEAGMASLQTSGRLQGEQRPWFEILSEEPILEQPLFGGWEQAAGTAMTHPLDRRQVRLRTSDDRVLYHRGESIVFEVATDRPGLLYLLVFSEGGRATCLFPNPSDPDNRIEAGKIAIPSHDGYRLPVQEPFGHDLVVALVSDRPLPLCRTVETTWEEIFQQVQLDSIHRRLRNEVRRGIGVAASAASEASSAEETAQPAWQSDELLLHTMATPPSEGDR